MHAEPDYVGLRVGRRLLIVAEALKDAFLQASKDGVVEAWKGSELEGVELQHPFMDFEVPVILGDHVTIEAGTGCVHTAPGHGEDDFHVGKSNGLETAVPVDRYFAGLRTKRVRMPRGKRSQATLRSSLT